MLTCGYFSLWSNLLEVLLSANFFFWNYLFNKFFQKCDSDWQFTGYSEVNAIKYQFAAKCTKSSRKVYVMLS